MLEEARHLADIHADDVVIVENSAGLEAASSSGRIALILAIEGAEPIGNSLEILDVLRRSGVRMCSLSWNRRTMMADGIAERDTGGRLTQLGVDAVSRMEELGIIVDVSHLSEAGSFTWQNLQPDHSSHRIHPVVRSRIILETSPTNNYDSSGTATVLLGSMHSGLS